METKILDGKKTSKKILEEVKKEISKYKIKPSMAILLVGNNQASETYVKFKLKSCKNAGIDAKVFRYDTSISSYELLKEIKKFNKSKFDGFIVQLPLPEHIDENSIINEISAYKDIDGFHPLNFGRMSLGQDSMVPATPFGIIKLLESYKIETKGKKVVIIGKSNIVGKPLSILLGNDSESGKATVTSCDINTPKNLLIEETKRADIIVVAVGKINLLTADMVKEGVVVIDVGINRLESGKLVGDCDFENISKKASYITPVPGGVGPMTIAGLILNTKKAWEIRNFLKI